MELSATDKTKWFSVDPDSPEAVVQAVVARAQAIETWTMGARYQNALYARLATGRDLPVLFGTSLSRRVGPSSAVFARSRFELPTHNIIAMGMETLYNRIGTNRPWVTVIPDGDFNARTQAKAQEAWFAKCFEKHEIYQRIVGPCFIDAGMWGDGFCLVDAWKGDVRYTRVLRDEVFVDEIAAARGEPPDIIIGQLVDREKYAEMYADDKEILDAIENAPPGITGQYGAGIGDVIMWYQAWKLPDRDGKHGRHVVCTANEMVKDVEWKRRRFPIARMKGIPQTLGFWNMGIPEAGWDYQLEVNRCMAVIHEGQKHGAIGTILAREDSNISTKQLASSLQQRIIRYDTEPPEFIAPPAVSPEMYSYRREVIQDFLMRIGLSPQQASGEKDPGITSGRAIITMEQIHDGRQINWGKNQEDFVTDLADLTYEAGEEVELSVETPEGPIEWSNVAMRPGGARRRAFPISSLPSEPAGRQQRIATWYANGFISRAEAFRLEDVPDTERFVSLATAEQDELEWTLDNIVTTQEPEPPESHYSDLASAAKTVDARYRYEKRRGAPPRVLKLIQGFLQQLGEIATNPGALPPAPAPSPPQVSPDMPAPTAPAPAPTPAQPMQAAA